MRPKLYNLTAGQSQSTCIPEYFLVGLRLLRTVLRATRHTASNTTQIHRTTNKGILHTGTILSTSTTDLDHTMLLDIVAFTRNISSNNLPRTQPHSCHLPLTRVRLLRLGNTSLKTNTLQPRRTLQRRRSTTTSPLSSSNTATDLVVRSADDRRARELPLRHGSEAGSSCAEDGVKVEAGGDGGLFRGGGDSG